MVGVKLGTGVSLGIGVTVGVNVGVAVGQPPVGHGVGETVAVGVCVIVGVLVGVGVGGAKTETDAPCVPGVGRANPLRSASNVPCSESGLKPGASPRSVTVASTPDPVAPAGDAPSVLQKN